MKKILLITAISFFILSSTESHAQDDGFLVGINFGVPVGEMHDVAFYNGGLDVSYLFDLSEVFQVGPMAAYTTYIINNEYADLLKNFRFIPLAATIRANISDHFMIGGDVGYALAITDGVDDGFFYRPKIAYLTRGGNLTLSYGAINADGGTYSTINIGVEFGL